MDRVTAFGGGPQGLDDDEPDQDGPLRAWSLPPEPGTKYLGIKAAEIKPRGRTYKTASLRFFGDDPENEPSRVLCTLGILCAGRPVGHVLGIVLGLSFGGWDSSEAVHEALLVVPGYVVGGEVFDVAEGVQGAIAKRRIGPDALVLVEPDRGLGQRVVVGVANAADRRSETRKAQCFAESHTGVLTRFNRWTQHLDDGGVFDGTTTGMGSGVDGAGGDALTGTAAGTQGS
jgi:hypothetical protein